MDLALLRLSALGDILRVLPAWTSLHRAFPEARLHAVVEDRHAFLLEPLPWLNPIRVRRNRLGNPFSALGELRRVAEGIRAVEISLDFHGILKSALIPKLAAVPERWGDGITREGAATLQTHRLPFQRQSRYDQALALAEAFGQSRGIAGLGRFRPVLKDLKLATIPSPWVNDGRRRILMVPGASRRGAIKRWPLRHWQRLTQMMGERFQLRWSLGPEEEALRSWLPAETGVEALPRMAFWELATAVQQADLVIAPDTGLLHLAVLCGVPVLGLFGGSDPVVADIPRGSGILLRTGIDCSPCRERKCLRRQCLEELSPERVLAAVLG